MQKNFTDKLSMSILFLFHSLQCDHLDKDLPESISPKRLDRLVKLPARKRSLIFEIVIENTIIPLIK
jgi:hypothetical protein